MGKLLNSFFKTLNRIRFKYTSINTMRVTMKNKVRSVFIFFFSLGMLLTSNAFSADNISVLKVDTLIMEKGSENYSLTVKAFVKNNGEADDAPVNVVAVDINGYDLQHATLTGFIKQGQTKVLVGGVKVPKSVYEEKSALGMEEIGTILRINNWILR